MRNALRDIPFALVMALVVASIVLVLVPTCTMASTACGSMGATLPSGALDLGSMLDCDGMYFSTDAPGATFIQFIAFIFVAAVAALFIPRLFMQVRPALARVAVPAPGPPPDPLMGRLLI